MKKDEKKYWLDEPGNVRKILYTLFAVCGALLLADFFYHKHVHFDWEGWFGFFGLFGFVAYTFIVFAGNLVRKLLMRDEDYYDR